MKIHPFAGIVYIPLDGYCPLIGGNLDGKGQAVFTHPVAKIPKGFSYYFQALVIDPTRPSVGGFTNLHMIKY